MLNPKTEDFFTEVPNRFPRKSKSFVSKVEEPRLRSGPSTTKQHGNLSDFLTVPIFFWQIDSWDQGSHPRSRQKRPQNGHESFLCRKALFRVRKQDTNLNPSYPNFWIGTSSLEGSAFLRMSCHLRLSRITRSICSPPVLQLQPQDRSMSS